MKAAKILLTLLLGALMAVSCVTGKRYNTLTDRNLMLMSERDSLKAENIWLTMSNRELTARSVQLTEDTEKLSGELQKTRDDLAQKRDEVNSLSARYDELQRAQAELAAGKRRRPRDCSANCTRPRQSCSRGKT
jgi:chromosome segregation ATPase